MPKIIQTQSGVTIAGWVTAITTKFYSEFRRLLIQVTETGGVNPIEYRVHGAMAADFVNFETLDDALGTTVFDVAAGANEYETLCDCWPWVRVQVRNDGGGANAGAYTITFSGG